MKRWIFTALLLVVASWASEAQNVTITGRSNKAETLMRLFVYEDLLNNSGKQLDECQTDAKGNFILECSLKRILPARIFIGLESVDLILSPNATYDIEIIVPEQQDNVSYFEKELPTIRVKRATDKGIYRQIIQADEIINGYLIEHFSQIYRGRQVRYLDSIENGISRALPDIKSDYVKSHIRYKLASIRLAISTDGGKKTVSEYFDGQPVLYTQNAYMDLFKELFNNQFSKPPYELHALNDAFATSAAALVKYLNSDPFMTRNPQLAELVAIYNLQRLCYGEPPTRNKALSHLKHFEEKSKYPEHKALIGNFLTKLNRLAPDSEATNFTLKDSDGRDVSLADFKHKVVLLQFVDGPSAVSERQFAELQNLHLQWQDSVQIVTIATRDKMEAYKKQFAEKQYGWPLLSLGNNILLLEAYDVRTFPEYILIKQGTKIGAAPAPAPAPDGSLEAAARKMTQKKSSHK